jgi:hypothetical protein
MEESAKMAAVINLGALNCTVCLNSAREEDAVIARSASDTTPTMLMDFLFFNICNFLFLGFHQK